ncbi:hypothetical protein ACQ33O_03085 [Ferruginibacter sp. SUN002]|uniref:hypothetical protein n=1 Tax=Ferruginibacter sp. SUN002 TaxID=2937789 RepID=UPI003D35EBB2
MKILLLFFGLSVSIKSFSQKVTYEDLIGTTWIPNNLPSTDSCRYTFIDSSHYKYYYSSTIPRKNFSWKFPQGMVFNYSLDTSHNITLWHLQEYNDRNVKISGLDRYIKFIDKNTLEVSSTKKRKKVTTLVRAK